MTRAKYDSSILNNNFKVCIHEIEYQGYIWTISKNIWNKTKPSSTSWHEVKSSAIELLDEIRNSITEANSVRQNHIQNIKSPNIINLIAKRRLVFLFIRLCDVMLIKADLDSYYFIHPCSNAKIITEQFFWYIGMCKVRFWHRRSSLETYEMNVIFFFWILTQKKYCRND